MLALVPTAVLLAGFITWGGNVDIPVSGNELGTIDYVDVDILSVVSHPCDGSDPVMMEVPRRRSPPGIEQRDVAA